MLKFDTKKRSKYIKKALLDLPTYSTCIDGVTSANNVFTYKVEDYEEAVYLKLYYKGDIDWKSVDNVYTYALTMLLKVNFRFQGITHYRENREICVTFLKKDA